MSTAKCQNPGSGGYNPIFIGEKIFKKVEICFENSYFSKKTLVIGVLRHGGSFKG